MKLFKRKGKANKTWRYRALVVDLSKTRVVFETTPVQEKKVLEKPLQTEQHRLGNCPTISSQYDSARRQHSKLVMTRAYPTHIFEWIGWSR